MKEKRKCKDCFFKDKWDGKCHRFPPALVGQSYNYAVALFPEVGLDEWCGEWQERKEED